MTHLGSLVLTLILLGGLTGCGVNNIPRFEEQAKADWRQVENQYQRRADLIPNLLETVKGYAAHERDTLQAIVEARAKATRFQPSADILSDPQALGQYQANQDALSSALSRLLVVVERYPDLKASQNFLTLQSQLEGTENRIAVARKDFINAVRLYNTELKTIPGRWWREWLYPENHPMASFTSAETQEPPPRVQF